MTTYKIKIEDAPKKEKERKYPFAKMKLGKSFFVPKSVAKPSAVRVAASTENKKETRRLRYEVKLEDGGCRVYCKRAPRPTAPTAPENQ